MDIDANGHLLIQEDPGGNAHIARIVAYDLDSGGRRPGAVRPRRGSITGAPGFVAQDEESSGIVEVRRQLRSSTFLFDAQVHARYVGQTRRPRSRRGSC